MPGANEDQLTDLAAPIREGLEQISRDQEITFTLYRKYIFPADKFVYWIKGSILVDPPEILTITVKGSLHRSANETQAEDGTYAINRIIFTSEEQVDNFNDVDPEDIWIGEFDGVRFAFNAILSQRYVQAGIWHYIGDAIYPAMETQIIDTPEQLDAIDLVVSNSLPIWMTLTQGGTIPVYPSFLVSDNIRPPYIAVHIYPEGTQAIQAAPWIDSDSSRYQLVQDRVRVTMYGLNNKAALDWMQYVADYSMSSDVLGLMNMPVPRDEKRIQTELSVIAQKKTVEFDVNYYQNVAYDVARQLILSATVNYTIGPPPVENNAMLLESGGFFLLEDGGLLELNP